MEIKILGMGCSNCHRLEQVARDAAQEAGITADFIKVTKYDEIMKYPILGTPGLVVNEQLKSAGRIPRKEEIIAWLKAAE
jgi:small redox-active disulfide protein 2